MYGVFSVDLELSKGEIIQIGFYKVTAKGKITEICLNVKPRKGFKIDPFVAKLTGITQEDLDRGCSLKDALNRIRKLGVSECTGIAWGTDFAEIERACTKYGLDNPFHKADTLVNYQKVTQAKLGLRQTPPLSALVEFTCSSQMLSEYRAGAHNALVDAKATYWVFRGS